MATPPKGIDRRAQRTRQLLRRAAVDAMHEKGFLGTTIQDIADRANVNRGTFYAHYPDKYALLDELVRENFEALLACKLTPQPCWNRETLHLLIKIVLEYFEEEYRQCEPTEIVDPAIERVAKNVLINMLLAWLEQKQSERYRGRVSIETIARVVSWTILGAASHWHKDGITKSADQVADEVLLVIMEGVARLAPGTQWE